jgi:hypothetical protein
MFSPEYVALEARLEELRLQFVDFDIPPDRSPTSQELSLIAAFKLLIHADIQTYIHDSIIKKINKSVNDWKNNRTVSRCMFHLIFRWSTENDGRYPDVKDSGGFDRLLKVCIARAKLEVAENNSIKRDAFLRLSFSAGLLTDEISGTLLGELDSFGKARGDVAHQSAGRVRTLNSPEVEAEFAKNIVKLLKDFDGYLSA